MGLEIGSGSSDSVFIPVSAGFEMQVVCPMAIFSEKIKVLQKVRKNDESGFSNKYRKSATESTNRKSDKIKVRKST